MTDRGMRMSVRPRGGRRRQMPPQVVAPPPVAGQPPPHDLDAEAAALSAALLDAAALDTVLDLLKADRYYSEAHARIHRAMLEVTARGEKADIVSVGSWLRDRDWLQACGGAVYLGQLADATPAISHVETHCKVVHDKWRARMHIAQCQRSIAECYDDPGDLQEHLTNFAHDTDALVLGGGERRQLRPVSDGIKVAFKQVSDAAARGERFTGTPTGLERLDAKIAGLNDGDLLIVAARPGMGKTSFVLNIAVNAASTRRVTLPRTDDRPAVIQDIPGVGVCVFSLEMPEAQCALRMTCSEGLVDLGRVRQGGLQPCDWSKLTAAASYLSALPIWIDDTPGITLHELAAKVRRKQAEYDQQATETEPARRVGMVIVDYLQLMRGREDAPSREQEVSELSRGLKALAKELKLPVVALSQLNRAVETRSTKDKRPQLSDLRESGAIEQDADTIIFIYRDDYYNPETSDLKGIAELIVAKQRNGPTGKVKVRFSASCTRFDNLDPGDYPEADEDE